MFELYLSNISKRYAHKTVLNSVSLSLSNGKINSLLGENGAGKSTLAAILAGLVVANEGKIEINNRQVFIKSPRDAIAHGISMVEQHPRLAEGLPLWQNCILGQESASVFGIINKHAEIESLCALSEQWAIKLNLNKNTKEAIPSERFFAAFFAALRQNPSLLILDEPSAVLDPNQSQLFYARLRTMVDKGLSVLLITHNIAEALQYSDEVSVLQKGQIIKTVQAKDVSFTNEAITSLLFNNVVETMQPLQERVGNLQECNSNYSEDERSDCKDKKKIFSIQNLDLKSDLPQHLSFEALSCEITAVLGKSDVLLHQFEDICTGMYRGEYSGVFTVCGDSFARLTPKILRSKKVSLIPSNKIFRGANPAITVYELLTSLRSYSVEEAEVLIEKQDVSINLNEKVSHLSGGMLQRLILARELAENPKVLILCEPTIGLDYEREITLWQSLRVIADLGCTVIVLTSSIANAQGCIDKIYDLKRGMFLYE